MGRAIAVVLPFASHPGASFSALRGALSTLAEAGATFGDVPLRYAAEWVVLGQEPAVEHEPLHEVALTASERRLHRESEQQFRVLCVAARALCHAAVELGRPLRFQHIAGSDLASLRGIMRAVEHAQTVPGVSFEWDEPTRTRIPLSDAADYRSERITYLRRIGFDLDPSQFQVDLAPRPDSRPPNPL